MAVIENEGLSAAEAWLTRKMEDAQQHLQKARADINIWSAEVTFLSQWLQCIRAGNDILEACEYDEREECRHCGGELCRNPHGVPCPVKKTSKDASP